jgi:hypothetical protein
MHGVQAVIRNYRTSVEMASSHCPQSKMFAEPQVTCRLGDCPLFREGDPITPAWTAAVAKLAVEIEDKSFGRTKAAKMVTEDPEAYGVERVFYCALGGKP